MRLLTRSVALVKLNQRHLIWACASVSSHFMCWICGWFLWFCSAILRTLWHRTGIYSGRLAWGSDGQSVCVSRVGWRSGRMTAGTVVITGGILATVILLCIIAVLCYCRLQVSASGGFNRYFLFIKFFVKANNDNILKKYGVHIFYLILCYYYYYYYFLCLFWKSQPQFSFLINLDELYKKVNQQSFYFIYKLYYFYFIYTLLKIKVLHDAIEEPFCLNGSIKNL